MIKRRLFDHLSERLSMQAAVVLLGPRQVGKTTLALKVAEEMGGMYLDLENPADLAKLSDPRLFLEAHLNQLVVLDEIHRMPGLFPVLRGLIDESRRNGKRTGLYLMLGSASMDLMRQSGESLAGRAAYLELAPIHLQEIPHGNMEQLWVRGGFPDSLLANNDLESMQWRTDMIRTYLEREIPQLGPRIPSTTLHRFWTMIAHNQGGLHNASKIATSLEVSSPTVGRYTDLLVDLLLARRLQPFHVNVGKRLVKSPKLYFRDSGWLHSLLQLQTLDEVLGHPIAGGSWEGFVIEQILQAAPNRSVPGFYRTSGGAEVDLVLELPGGERWVMEIKRSPAAKPQRGFHEARMDLQANRAFVVHAGEGRFLIREDVESIGLSEILRLLHELES